MRACVIIGQLEGWYGLDRFAEMLRLEGMSMGPVKPAPVGVIIYRVSDDIVVTLAGHHDAGYAFSIAITADADTIEALKSRLTEPGASVYVGEPYMKEITYKTTPIRR